MTGAIACVKLSTTFSVEEAAQKGYKTITHWSRATLPVFAIGVVEKSFKIRFDIVTWRSVLMQEEYRLLRSEKQYKVQTKP